MKGVIIACVAVIAALIALSIVAFAFGSVVYGCILVAFATIPTAALIWEVYNK